MKLLEARLGVALFRRQPQGLTLTDPGRLLLPELTGAFERIARAARRAADSGGELRILAPPTFATRWLVPRLGQFQDRHPDRRINLGLLWRDVAELQRGGFDVGITWQEASEPPPVGYALVPLWQEALTPVCSPRLLERGPPLATPRDLGRHTLLHPTSGRQDWRKWLRLAGLDQIDPESGQTFVTLEMAVGAAVAGMGVAVADLNLIGDELAAGKLVVPFRLVIEDGSGYTLFAEPERLSEPLVGAFCAWIRAASQPGGG